ncbi:hypothetical protein L1049_025788 [Liquidambar formosana]|uniref:Uncharacterized protein n=1 Tax=Liquidambar formosana TaxID=63359 RepID=A0AAP0NBJ4_LIQFO
MTVEADAHGDLSVVSKAEIEDDCGLDMSSYQDLPNGGGGDCNGVLHDERQEEEEGIVANGKDDADSSYVFVSGTDAVADDPLTRDLNAECVEESNVGSPKEEEEEEEEEEIDVRVGESEVDNGENLQSHVEDNCIVEGTVIAPSNNDVAFTGSQDNVQSHVEDNCIVEGTVVAPSDNDVALEGPPCESNGDQEGRSDVVEEQNETVAVESEPQQIDSEVKVEEQIKLESSSKLEDSQESRILVLEEAGCELPELDNGSVKDEEQNIIESLPEVERSRESQLKIPKPAESELNNDEEEVEGESKSDSAIDMKENHEPANMVSEDVRLELDQEKEAAKSADEIAAEGPPGDHGLDKESDLEMSTSPCPGTYIQLETEVGNDSASDENGNSLLICHVEDGIPETQVINDLVAGSQNTHELDGSSKNAESLPLSVDCVRPEIEVGDVSFESSEGLPSGPDSDSVLEPDVGTGASLITENSPSSAISDVRSTT